MKKRDTENRIWCFLKKLGLFLFTYYKSFTIYHYFLLIILGGYFVILAPRAFHATQSFSEMWAYDMHEPYLVNAFRELVVLGKISNSLEGYGYFPTLLTAFLSLPIVLAIKTLNIVAPFQFYAIAVCWTQIIVAIIGGIYTYKMTVLFARPVWGLFTCFAALFMYDFVSQVLVVSPDIHLSVLILISTYYLILFYEKKRTLLFCTSAFFAGLAAATKYIGFFLIPVAAITYGLSINTHDYKAIFRNVFFGTVIFSSILLLSMILFFPQIIFNFQDTVHWLFGSSKYPGSITSISIVNQFLPFKIRILFAERMLGSTFFAIFCVASIYFALHDIYKKRLSAPNIINGVIATFLVFYFFIFNYTFNLPSFRHALPFILLTPPVVAWFLDECLRSQGWKRNVGIALSTVVLLTQITRVVGLETWNLPIPIFRDAISNHEFYGLSRSVNGNMRKLLEKSYVEEGVIRKLRRDLPKKDIGSLGTFWKSYYYNFGKVPHGGIYKLLKNIMLRDKEGTIQVRNWIKQNVPANKHIYVQYYMNIRPLGKDTPKEMNADLQRLVIEMEYVINTYFLNKSDPDYVFLHLPRTVKELTVNPPPWHLYNYRLVAVLSGGTKTRNVYVLQKIS